MNYAYLRVSTQEQNLKNQELEIKRHYHIDKWYYDKKSGTLDYHKRNLNSIINEMQKDDILIVTELSRLGRSIIMIFQIVTEIQSKGCGIIAIKNNFNISPLLKVTLRSFVIPQCVCCNSRHKHFAGCYFIPANNHGFGAIIALNFSHRRKTILADKNSDGNNGTIVLNIVNH